MAAPNACLHNTWNLLITIVPLSLPARPPSPSASDAPINFIIPTPGGSLRAKRLAGHQHSRCLSNLSSISTLPSLATLLWWPWGPGLLHIHPVEPLLSCRMVAWALLPSRSRRARSQAASQLSDPLALDVLLNWKPPPCQLTESCLMLCSAHIHECLGGNWVPL